MGPMTVSLIVDVRAQTDILTHSSFVPFIDRATTIQPIDEIFSRTLQNERKKNMKLTRPVHAPWVELTKEHNITWEPSWQDKYTGPQGGPPAGPTQFIDCRMCYRKQLTTELSAKDRRKTSRTSRMGCPICKEPICKECWKEGYDKHA